MSNYDYLKSLDLGKYAQSRIDQIIYDNEPYWIGDFDGEVKTIEEATKIEIERLNKEREENKIGI